VAGGAAERRRHVGEQRDRGDAGVGAEATIVAASSRAASRLFMNAPVPTLTSSTSAPVPSAIFLLMIELAISGIDSTVAVTSRKA
jgi:hypothetical protein